ASRVAAATVACRSSGFLKIGTITTWIGANRGGSTSPWSSECVMISPPISRVETPQLVAQGYSRWPAWFWNCTSKPLPKFWPRRWGVAGWRRPPVLHHRLDAQRVDGAGELLPLTLGAGQDRHRHKLLGEGAVHLQHAVRLLLRLLLRGVGGVPLLPEELGGAQ